MSEIMSEVIAERQALIDKKNAERAASERGPSETAAPLGALSTGDLFGEVERLKKELAAEIADHADTQRKWDEALDAGLQVLADLEAWQKRSGDLYELAVSLKRHASEAQSMYGVHAEELIADADRALSDVNSKSLPNIKVTQMTEPHGVSTPKKDNRSSCV